MTDRTTPAKNGVAITTSDTVNFTNPVRGIYVGNGGTVVARMNGSDITFSNVQSGSILPIEPERINATGTTASNLVQIW